MCISDSQVTNFGIAVFAGIVVFARIRRLNVITGERSEPSVGRRMENFVLSRMPVCGIYVYVHSPESTRDFTNSTKGNGCCEELAMDTLDSLMMEENGCSFEL